MAGFWETIVPGGLGAYGYSKVMDDIKNQQSKVGQTIADIRSDVAAGSEFKPYGITSNIGTATGSTEGIDFSLSPEQAAQQAMLASGGTTLMGNVMAPRDAREMDVYERIRATQMPEEARQRENLRQGLFSSGRGGISSLQGGGGTPEQLAFETARAEAMNRASLAAMQQAYNERGQDYQIGQGMLTQQYAPLMQLRENMGYGLNNAQLAQRGALDNVNLQAQLALGGLTADTNYENIKANAFGNMITAALPLAKGTGSAIDSFWNKLNLFG